MSDELIIDDLPAAGVPLQPHIDEDNQALIETQLQERIARQQYKLSRQAYRRLSKRWKQLQKRLNDAGYNDLITRRWDFNRKYQELKYALHNEYSEEKYTEFQEVRRNGIVLNEKIAALQPLSDEFDRVNDALKAHDEVIVWENEDAENYEAFKREAHTWEEQLKSAFRQSPRLQSPTCPTRQHCCSRCTERWLFCRIGWTP